MTLEVAPLGPTDAQALLVLISAPDDAERRYFDGLPTEPTALCAILEQAVKDRYWSLKNNGNHVAIFMLRGLDAGFHVPAFGILVAKSHRGKGLGRLALQFCETWCVLAGVHELMLSVSPDNLRALTFYERHGFRATEEISAKGNAIYRKKLSL